MTVNSSKAPGAIRIIGGQWRSRTVAVADAPGLRPTPDRVRETLFNWLQFSLAGARCLDLFAGSGILGLEALSRGAAAVTALECDAGAAALLRRNAATLHADALQVLQQDALHWLAQGPGTAPYDIAFIDPPFAAQLQQRSCALLHAQQWLAPGARVYLEAAQPLDGLPLPPGWALVRHKRAGEVHYGLCEAN